MNQIVPQNGSLRPWRVLACLTLAGAWVLTGFSNAPGNPIFPSSKFQLGKKFTFEEGYSRLPLTFEPNQGQTDPRVKFLARGTGYTLFLTGSSAVLALKRSNPGVDSWRHPFPRQRGRSHSRFSPPKASPYAQDVLRLTFNGAASQASFEGQDSLSGVSNYFIGHDSSQWHTKVPHYGRVQVRGIYPGVDMAYYGNAAESNRLEYDLEVKPGTDPGVIRIKCEGADSAQVDAAGNLQLEIGGRTVALRAPLLYQEVNGNRKAVEGGYRPTGDREVGFEVKEYDKTKPLVIDPILDYSTYVGGTSNDGSYRIKVDAGGDAYIAGWANSADYPTTAGAFQTANNAFAAGGSNAVVTKLNPTGTALVYSTYLGGSTTPAGTPLDIGIDLYVDGAGDAYVTGFAHSTDFPTTAGAFQSANNAAAIGSNNAFVSELNPSGSVLLYSTYLGGSNNSVGDGIAVDGGGNVYVGGYTFDPDFPTTAGAFQAVNNALGDGGANAFATKLNPASTTLAYSTYLGGSTSDYGDDMTLQGGTVYLTGYTYSSNFPTTAGAYQVTNNALGVGGSNAFVTQVNASGNGLLYSTYVGGSGNAAAGFNAGDEGWGITVDGGGDAYVTGDTNSANFPTTAGAYQAAINAANGNNAFVTKLNPGGTALVYSTYLGGGTNDDGLDVALDAGNCAYVTGFTDSANFPTTTGAYQSVNNAAVGGGGNAFLTEINSAGVSLYYSTYLGGSVNDFGYGIALDPNGGVYVCGYTESLDFPTTAGAFQTQNNTGGGENDFVTKFDVSDFLTPTPTLSPTPTPPPDVLSLSLNLLNQASGPVSIHEVIAEYPGHYSLRVYNTAGELIKVLDDNTKSQSLSTGVLDAWVTWDGTNTHGDKVASGVYVIELSGPFHTMIGRIAVVK